MMRCYYKLILFLACTVVSSCHIKKVDRGHFNDPISTAKISSPSSITTREQFFSHQRRSYYEQRLYQPLQPVVLEAYENNCPEIQNFLAMHKHNSPHKPLIGIVTNDSEDLVTVNNFLVRVQKEASSAKHLHLLADEILAKIIAYRELKVGETVFYPLFSKKGKTKLISFKVDKRFNLLGMPAYGLVPNKKKIAPILLFRGTDFSATVKGYSSILADLDLQGPGVLAFFSAQDQIHQWLLKVNTSYPKARALGYSLGGALTQYLCIYEYLLLSHDERFPSVAFNQPGVSEELVYKWNRLKNEEKPYLKGFVTEGDIVSSVGKLIGNVEAMTLDYPLEPLNAHVTLMSAQQRVYTYKLDVTLKNALDYSAQAGASSEEDE